MKSSSIPSPFAGIEGKAGIAAAFLRELANEKRLMILCKLMEQRELSVQSLADEIDLSQSAVSQHLARLREHNLVRMRRDGTTVYYAVSDKSVGRILKALKETICK
jgi:ArsR family transcriptional regulator, virulence genes transcriptional regulator